MSDSQRMKDLALSDTGFVFDPYSGATFTVNATGLAVLRALKDDLPRQEIAARLQEGFETAPNDDLSADVDDFVRALAQHGLVRTSEERA